MVWGRAYRCATVNRRTGYPALKREFCLRSSLTSRSRWFPLSNSITICCRIEEICAPDKLAGVVVQVHLHLGQREPGFDQEPAPSSFHRRFRRRRNLSQLPQPRRARPTIHRIGVFAHLFSPRARIAISSTTKASTAGNHAHKSSSVRLRVLTLTPRPSDAKSGE